MHNSGCYWLLSTYRLSYRRCSGSQFSVHGSGDDQRHCGVRLLWIVADAEMEHNRFSGDLDFLLRVVILLTISRNCGRAISRVGYRIGDRELPFFRVASLEQIFE